MKKFIDSFLWAFLAIFSIPTILIMASWNSLPGDPLYQVKRELEHGLLFVAPTYAAKGNLQMKYTQRRYLEAKRLLDEKQSSDGLQYLNRQVNKTREAILSGSNSRARQKLAYSYIDTLSTLHTELEVQKIAHGGSQIPAAITKATVSKKPSPRPSVTPSPTPVYQTPPPQPEEPESDETIVDEINETQQEIEETIGELEDAANNPALQSSNTEGALGSEGVNGTPSGENDDKEEKKEKDKEEEKKNEKRKLPIGETQIQPEAYPMTEPPKEAQGPTNISAPTIPPEVSPTPAPPVDVTPTP